ncbi:MAG: hypothetical protein WDO18_15630 [Acidobacteriota bacterium]
MATLATNAGRQALAQCGFADNLVRRFRCGNRRCRRYGDRNRLRNHFGHGFFEEFKFGDSIGGNFRDSRALIELYDVAVDFMPIRPEAQAAVEDRELTGGGPVQTEARARVARIQDFIQHL